MKKYIIILFLGIFLLGGVYTCPLYQTIGIPCPGCGATRAFKLFLCGDIVGAFCMHPLFWVPAIFIFKHFQKKRYLVAVLILFIIVYLVRMMTMFPHTPPMNYNYNSIIGEFFK